MDLARLLIGDVAASFSSTPTVANIRFYVLYWRRHWHWQWAHWDPLARRWCQNPLHPPPPQICWMLRRDDRVAGVRWMCCAHYSTKHNDSSTVTRPFIHASISQRYNTMSEPGVARSSQGRYGCRLLRRFPEPRRVSVPYQVFIRIDGFL